MNRFGRPMPLATSTIDGREARAQLSMLLAGATDERLRGFTAAGLAATHRVKRAVVEEMLAEARRRRGVDHPLS